MLGRSDEHGISIPGLTINLDSLSAQYQQRTETEIRHRIEELTQEHADLEKQRQTAVALDAAVIEKKRLKHQVREIEHELEAFDLFTELQQDSEERATKLLDADRRVEEITEQIGFTRPDNGTVAILFHNSNLIGEAFCQLAEGKKASFSTQNTDKGLEPEY